MQLLSIFYATGTRPGTNSLLSINISGNNCINPLVTRNRNILQKMTNIGGEISISIIALRIHSLTQAMMNECTGQLLLMHKVITGMMRDHRNKFISV
jgi:hypothetical protein